MSSSLGMMSRLSVDGKCEDSFFFLVFLSSCLQGNADTWSQLSFPCLFKIIIVMLIYFGRTIQIVSNHIL